MAAAWCKQILSFLVPNSLHPVRARTHHEPTTDAHPTDLASTFMALALARNRAHSDNLLPEELQPRRVNLPFFSRNDRAEFPRLGESVIIDMLALAENPPKKEVSTLFGPSLTKGKRKNDEKADFSSPKDTDEVEPEVVTNWAAQTKQPTTTLQALVNLKRPSLHLSPLHPIDSSTDQLSSSDATHALEFEFDCDAPKCQISVLVDLPVQPSSGPAKEKDTSQKHVAFQTIVPGGFSRALKLEDGASLDLAKYERKPTTLSSTTELASTLAGSSPALPQPTDGNSGDATTQTRASRKRLSVLPFRRRGRQDVAGPALQVVDLEKAGAEGEEKDTKENQGVRLVLRLEALDEEGGPLPNPNAQSTFLQIVRVGTAPASGQPDTRPWIVTVVRREATIGAHTFRLHEIYGFSTATTQPATDESQPHTYPPPPVPASADSAASECVLCLSSPREVVLLPCRHLVACKECAINMVEYGAGGQLVHTNDATEESNNATNGGEEPSTGAAENAENAPVEGPSNGETATAAGNAPEVRNPSENATGTRRAHRRRKRKAKGWFCPVCREPYTSLLRITTAPPEKSLDDADSSGHSHSNSIVAPANHDDRLKTQNDTGEGEPATVERTTASGEETPDIAESAGVAASPRPSLSRSRSASVSRAPSVSERVQ